MPSANVRGLAGFAFAVLVAGLASAQSMGDAAQRERERREKLKQKGDRTAVVTSDELKANRGALANDPNAAAPAPGGSASPPPRTSREPERRAGEQEWRKRMTLARERAARAQEQYDYWSSQHLGPSEYFVDQ